MKNTWINIKRKVKIQKKILTVDLWKGEAIYIPQFYLKSKNEMSNSTYSSFVKAPYPELNPEFTKQKEDSTKTYLF